MATKLKRKPKAIKKTATAAQSVRLKAKPAKLSTKKSASRPALKKKANPAKALATKKNKPKFSRVAAPKKPAKRMAKVELRRTPVAAKALATKENKPQFSRVAAPKKPAKRTAKVALPRTLVAAKSTPAPAGKVRSRHYASALQAYEAGIKLMHAEAYPKAIKCFQELVNEYSEEPEIQARAKVLIHASGKRIHEKTRTVVRSADDHYNIAIGELNRRALDSALQHLQQALKLAPKGDHILYGLAAVNALQGNRDQALAFLKQSIHHRPENRFFAARDEDFNNLNEDSAFKQLVTPSEK